jgi:hypothetical protein
MGTPSIEGEGNMNKKILLPIIVLAALATIMGIANAQIKVSIQVKDSNGNDISGSTVLIGTTAHVYGHYEDLGGNAQAYGWIKVYFDDGTGFKYETTLFSGPVNDGDTVEGTPYPMSKMGTYNFTWRSQKTDPTIPLALRCQQEGALARTIVQLHVPEPATLIGLTMALSAFGLLALKKTRAK